MTRTVASLRPRREELRQRHGPLLRHRSENRADLALVHAAEDRPHSCVVETLDDRRGFLGSHARVDLRHRDGTSSARWRCLESRELLAERDLERLQRGFPPRHRLLASLELLPAPLHRLEQLPESTALLEELLRDRRRRARGSARRRALR